MCVGWEFIVLKCQGHVFLFSQRFTGDGPRVVVSYAFWVAHALYSGEIRQFSVCVRFRAGVCALFRGVPQIILSYALWELVSCVRGWHALCSGEARQFSVYVRFWAVVCGLFLGRSAASYAL